jgi:hypothetical protein
MSEPIEATKHSTGETSWVLQSGCCQTFLASISSFDLKAQGLSENYRRAQTNGITLKVLGYFSTHEPDVPLAPNIKIGSGDMKLLLTPCKGKWLFGVDQGFSGRAAQGFNQALWFVCASWRALGRRTVFARALAFLPPQVLLLWETFTRRAAS